MIMFCAMAFLYKSSHSSALAHEILPQTFYSINLTVPLPQSYFWSHVECQNEAVGF